MIVLWKNLFEADQLMEKLWRMIVGSNGIKSFGDIINWTKANAEIDRKNNRIIIKGDLDLENSAAEDLPEELYVDGDIKIDQRLNGAARKLKREGKIQGKVILDLQGDLDE